MRTVAYESVLPLIKTHVHSQTLIYPLSTMMMAEYPASIETSFHKYQFYHVLWARSGEIHFQEKDGEYLKCLPGKILFIPPDIEYRWKTINNSVLFQCHHSGFNMREHSYLCMLSGSFQRHMRIFSFSHERLEQFCDDLESCDLDEKGVIYSGFFLALLGHVLHSSDILSGKDELSAPAVDRAVFYMERHLDRSISLSELSKYAGMGVSRLSELFRAEFSCSPMQYFAKRKLEKAETLLAASTLSISEIAESLGFTRPNYFSRFIKKQCGKSPVEIRNQR